MTEKGNPMNISPNEAEEELAAIQRMMQKTRHSIASGGTYITLIVTGIIWLVGFMCTQFLPKEIVGYIWTGLSILGCIVGTILGIRLGKRVRSPATAPMAKRVGLFWLLLVFFAIAAIAVAQPTDGKQATMLVILFIMLGQMARDCCSLSPPSGGRCQSPPWRWWVTSCCPIFSISGWPSWVAAG